jgi:hypothetical protein
MQPLGGVMRPKHILINSKYFRTKYYVLLLNSQEQRSLKLYTNKLIWRPFKPMSVGQLKNGISKVSFSGRPQIRQLGQYNPIHDKHKRPRPVEGLIF